MSIVVTDSKNYTAIAEKIREKTGGNALYYPSEMPSGIREVYETGKQTFGVLETVHGAGAVRANYVNPTEHCVPVSVASKNLNRYFKTYNNVTYWDELTFTYEDNGSTLVINGTTTEDENTRSISPPVFLPENNYVITVIFENMPEGISSGHISTRSVWVTNYYSNGDGTYVKSLSGGIDNFLLTFPASTTFVNTKIKVQIELADIVEEATDFTPFVENVSTAKLNRFGKNLFDKNNPNIISNWIAGSSTILNGGVLNTAATTKSIYIPCVPNVTYTVSKIASARFSIAFANDVPNTGMQLSEYVGNFTSTELTSTAPVDAKYLVVWCYHQNYDTDITFEEIIDSLQIEVGGIATDYEPYIEPIEYSVNTDGTADDVMSFSPCMTFVASDSAVAVEVTYYTDIGGKIQALSDAILNLGGEL